MPRVTRWRHSTVREIIRLHKKRSRHNAKSTYEQVITVI
jgi:hypothetical protein